MPLRHRLLWLVSLALLVLIAFGCNSNNSDPVGANQRPNTVVLVTPSDPLPGQVVTVDASGSTDDGIIQRFDIVIRDGNGLTVAASSSKNPIMTIQLNAGTYSATVLVVDGRGESTARTINFVVSNCGPGPQTLTDSLPPAVEGNTYDTQILLSGGVAPLSIHLATGFTLPDGLTLSPEGQLAGTPAVGTTGEYLLRLVVQDSCDVAARKQSIFLPLTILVNSAGCPPLSITSGNPPDGTVGVPYTFALTTDGGQPPVFFDVVSGGLPSGLILSGNQLSGTPTVNSIYVFGLRASDSCPTFPQVVVENYTMRVN